MRRLKALVLCFAALVPLTGPAMAGKNVQDDIDSDMTEVVLSAQPRLRDAEAVAATRYLEHRPRGDAAHGLRLMLVQWLQASKGFSIIACDAVLAPLPNESMPNAAELMGQFMFGSAAHQIEHPQDRDAMVKNIVAGMHSMLKTYAALCARNPSARIPRLDTLLQLERRGQLSEVLGPQMTHDCRAIIFHN